MYPTPGDFFQHYSIFQRSHLLLGHSTETRRLTSLEDVVLVRKTINALTKSMFEEIAKSFGAILTFARPALRHGS